jgi:UDP-glucose 4-epimerase
LDALRKETSKGRKTPPAIVYSSTAALYGDLGNDGRALEESEIAEEFSSFYAAQKHASEKAIQLYANFHGIPATIFRFFNVFGPGQDPKSPYSGVISVLMELAREGKPLPLNGGGSQTRDFISVHDIVLACAAVLEVPTAQWTSKPMNLGSGASITIRQLAEMISRIHGGKPKLVDAPPREGDVLHSRADITRAREILGFTPAHSLQQGLQEI